MLIGPGICVCACFVNTVLFSITTIDKQEASTVFTKQVFLVLFCFFIQCDPKLVTEPF